ncbi:hypothetical protein PR202_gn00005 [Eleusine coracana subsp. coracana]|uniref:Uncharacterized protein n=1 Tax=Eleusine coracana subsp. coracana TaxID=191504 RepID=A0AAV5G0E6_ELECO|nr:hypothetical protein PR202_gn00005 [Eleusine coracana subsp. coracana]
MARSSSFQVTATSTYICHTDEVQCPSGTWRPHSTFHVHAPPFRGMLDVQSPSSRRSTSSRNPRGRLAGTWRPRLDDGGDGLLYSSEGDSSSIHTNGEADSSENESEDCSGGTDSQFLLWGDVAARQECEEECRRGAGCADGDGVARKEPVDGLSDWEAEYLGQRGTGQIQPGVWRRRVHPCRGEVAKRVMGDEKLAEMTLTDPKRVKR